MPQRAATIEGLPTQTSPCPRRSTNILAGSLDGSWSAMGDERNRVVLGLDCTGSKGPGVI